MFYFKTVRFFINPPSSGIASCVGTKLVVEPCFLALGWTLIQNVCPEKNY